MCATRPTERLPNGHVPSVRAPARSPSSHLFVIFRTPAVRRACDGLVPEITRYRRLGKDQLAAPPFEHAEQARLALRAIVAEHGPEVLSSPAALSNLLSDLLPDSPRIAEIPAAAAQDQIADELREHTSVGMDTRTASRLAASSFAEATMFAPEACAWVVDEFARALGLASDGAAAAALLTSTVPDSSLMNQERSSISAEHLIPKPEDSGAGPAGSGPPSQDSGTARRRQHLSRRLDQADHPFALTADRFGSDGTGAAAPSDREFSKSAERRSARRRAAERRSASSAGERLSGRTTKRLQRGRAAERRATLRRVDRPPLTCSTVAIPQKCRTGTRIPAAACPAAKPRGCGKQPVT